MAIIRKRTSVNCKKCPFTEMCFQEKEKIDKQEAHYCPVAKLINGDVKIVSEGKLLYKLTS
jgi:hypothetical protein